MIISRPRLQVSRRPIGDICILPVELILKGIRISGAYSETRPKRKPVMRSVIWTF